MLPKSNEPQDPKTIAFCISGESGDIIYTDPPEILQECPYVAIQEYKGSEWVGHYTLDNGVYLCTIDEEGVLKNDRIAATQKDLRISTEKDLGISTEKDLGISSVVSTTMITCIPPKRPVLTSLGWKCI
jgi:hypothetical protein